MSMAATRGTSSAGSSVTSYMTMLPFRGQMTGGCPRESEGTSEAESRARGNNAGPLARLPAPDSYAGLSSTKHRRRAATPDFHARRASPAGHRRIFAAAATSADWVQHPDRPGLRGRGGKSAGCVLRLLPGDITGWLGVTRFDSLVARRLW